MRGQKETVKITYQGHASFKIVSNDGVVIYIDPYEGRGYDELGDLLLITHNHYDHTMYRQVSLKKDGDVLNIDDFIVNNEYQTIETRGIVIETVPAYNYFHPKGKGVGLLLNINGVLIYHTGDTGQIEEINKLKDRHIDVLLCPIDGMFTMAPEEAMGLNEYLKPKYAVPMHMIPGKLFSIEQALKFKGSNVRIMTPGDRLNVEVVKK